MKTIDCLCFGACVLDEIQNTGTFNLGGDAANQTILLKRLKFNSQLCALVGQDDAAVQIIQKLHQHSIPTSTVIMRPDLKTTHSIIHLDESGERSFTVTGGAHREMTKADFPFHLIKQCRALSLGSMFTLHHLEEDGLLDIIKTAKEENCLIFCDTSTDRHHKGLQKVSEYLPYIDYFMPSYDEAKQLTNQIKPDEIAKTLFDHGARCIVLKLGSDGAVLYHRNHKITHPGFKANVINTTGAGDNFCAGFIASILSGHNESQALSNACWMGARAVEKHGTTETDFSPLPFPFTHKEFD